MIDKLMPPPWLMYPHILQGSIGWRMGYGEDYMMKFHKWFSELSESDQDNYKEMFPGPLNFIGWYGKYNPKLRTRFNVEWVIDNIDNGFIFFWGHRPSKDGTIIKSCLSQWWPCDFKVGHLNYSSSEQYMMACKARLFRDAATEKKIMDASNPKIIKQLGREVVGFDADIWDKYKYEFVLKGNYCKFSQNPELMEYLLGTINMILVEASPYDNVWGIGMTEDDVAAQDPCSWKGENYLGFALMEVRENILQAYEHASMLDFDPWDD